MIVKKSVDAMADPWQAGSMTTNRHDITTAPFHTRTATVAARDITPGMALRMTTPTGEWDGPAINRVDVDDRPWYGGVTVHTINGGRITFDPWKPVRVVVDAYAYGGVAS